MNFVRIGPFQVSEEVNEALGSRRPLVFGESTIFLTGLSWPSNYDCFIESGNVVRSNGAVPAMCMIYEGVPTIGCPDELMKELCQKSSSEGRGGIVKVNMSNFCVAKSKNLTGATTISASAFIAKQFMEHQTGKSDFVFATGGIGGIGKDAATTFDISNDTEFMAHNRFAIFSSFDKKIMDLPAVRERAETDGVPLIAYEQDDLPAFYCEHSGLKPDARVDSIEEMVSIYGSHRSLDLNTAVSFCIPCPEEYALPSDVLDEIESRAISDASNLNINSRDLTPYLLGRIRELTLEAKEAGKLKYDSLDANLQLFYNNNRMAAKFASAVGSF